MGKSVKEFLKTQLVQVGHFIYNPKTKEVFGRTGCSWFQILAYLTLLYIFLAALLTAHIYLFVAVTPKPGPDVRPWNYGRYAYPNYPNAKIALISNPSGITYNKPVDLSTTIALAKGQNITCGQYNPSNMYTNCVLIYVARTFDWKPELIDSTVRDHLPINCTTNIENYTVNSWPVGGIPLNLPNNVDSSGRDRSFPYRNQNNFTLPVMAVWVTFKNSNTTQPPLPVTVTCSIPYSSLETPVFNINHTTLGRIYEYPADVQFTLSS